MNDGKKFEKDVAAVLRLMGYTVEPNKWKAGRQTDLVAKKFSYPINNSFLVECKDWESDIGINVVTDMHARIEAVRRTSDPDVRGWIIGSRSFTMNGSEHARSLGINVTTFDELLGEMVDFRPYLTRFVDEYESIGKEFLDENENPINQPMIDMMIRCDLFRYFVPLDFVAEKKIPTKEKNRIKIEKARLAASAFIHEWLLASERNHLTILGDFGSGKSSFVLNLSYELSKQYLGFLDGIGERCRIPLFVPLRDYHRNINIESLVTNLLDNAYGIDASWQKIQRLISAGLILLILDGFDEMITKSSQKDTIENFREICKLAKPGTKTIITCRTHYFRDSQEVRDTFGIRHEGSSPLMELLRSDPGFEVVDLAPLNDSQIKGFLERRLGRRRCCEVLNEMSRTYNLRDLSQRPVLCDMIARTLPDLIKRGSVINASELYDAYTSHWIDTDDWRSVMTPFGKRQLMENLSVSLFFSKEGAENQSIHYSELPEPQSSFFKKAVRHDQSALDLYDHDTRTCTFLNRDDTGNYKFIHKSFLEFFVAKRLQMEVEDRSPELLVDFSIRSGNQEVMFFLRGLNLKPDDVVNLLGDSVLSKDGNHELVIRVFLPTLLEPLTPKGHVAWACACYRAFAYLNGRNRRINVGDLKKVRVPDSISDVERWLSFENDALDLLKRAVMKSVKEGDEVAYRVTSCARRTVGGRYPSKATNSLSVNVAKEVLINLEYHQKNCRNFWKVVLPIIGQLALNCGDYRFGPGSRISVPWLTSDRQNGAKDTA